MRPHVLHRAALGAAAALLVACGELPLAPTIGGPSFDEGEPPVEVLYPSLEVYRGEPEADASAMMSMSVASTMPLVRVAVLDSANSVPFGNGSSSGRVFLGGTGAWTLKDRSNGVTLLSGNGGSVEITLASVTETNYRLQVTCSSASAVNTLKALAESFGHPTLVAAGPGCTQLLVGKFASNASFTIRNNYKNLLISQGIAKSDAFWRLITFGQAVYRVHTGSSTFDNLNPVAVTAAPGTFVTIGNGAGTKPFRQFRGTAYAIMTQAGKLAGVNELPMEDYLRGVVPRELGPLLYPQVEAQKAQAVAARTYALVAVRAAKRGADGYDIRSTTADQVYGGYEFEQPMSNEAIDATAGVVGWYNGALISMLYSSASGGHTANADEAYANAVPYLQGIPDAERGQAYTHVPSLEVFRAHANPTSLRAVKEGDFETDVVSRHRWTDEWTAEEIRGALSSWRGIDVGRVHAINVLQRGPSGRVTLIEYVTDAGTFTASKDGIRTSLRYVTSTGGFASMWSTLFFIEPVKERGEWTGGFRIYGGGFGHGVGMSQTGAVGMAEKGHTYDQILHHYYQGITLAPAY